MKAAEQATFLAGTKVSIAVGTPARVGKLLAEGEFTDGYPHSLVVRHRADLCRRVKA